MAGNRSRPLSKFQSIALLVATIVVSFKSLWASPPVHLKLSENSKTGAEGSSIQVNCTVSMSQAPKELKWELSSDDKPNVEQEMISQNTVALRIVSLKRTNAGQYTCLLIMPDGKEEKKQFRLLVQQANDEVCNRFQFKCAKTRICLFLKYRCDGVDDCGDGSDEQCDIDPCLNKFKCNNSRCIEHKLVCDHVNNCGDHSDEICAGHKRPPSTAPPVNDDNTYTWLQITVSSFIAVTLGLVFCISFIVIMVFRNRVRRLREQRIARAHERLYQEDVRLNRPVDGIGGHRDPSSPGHSSDQQQFLLGPPHSHYGNIIVNVNNGVQYIPGYDYAILMDVPPPYSEVGAAQSAEGNPPPPAYSTLEHQNVTRPCRNSSGPHTQGSEDRTPEASSQRHPHPTERCATVHAADVSNQEPVARATISSSERSCSTNQNSASQTLPTSVDIINPEFLQSLLGPQVQAGDRTAPCTNQDSLRARSNRGGTPVLLAAHYTPSNSNVNLVHRSASPKHTRASSTSPHQDLNASDNTFPRSSQTGIQNADLQIGTSGLSNTPTVSSNQTEVLPLYSDFAGNLGTVEGNNPHHGVENQNFPENETSLLHGDEDEGEYCTESANEEGTFLIRKPRHRPSPTINNTETSIPSPIPSSNTRHADDASNALLNEVSKRDDRSRPKPKPGHLAVQGGEIMLHTPAGILRDLPQVPTSQSHSSSVPAAASGSDSPEAPELILQNGSLVFGTRSKQPTQPNSLSQNLSSNAVDSARGEEETEYFPQTAKSSSTSQEQQGSSNAIFAATASSSADASVTSSELSDTLRRKELQFKNGELVLESPKQTPSSQILSHLKGAYAEEEGMAEAIEPVVNTKRGGGAVSSKPQSQKINSDVVLPPKTYQH